MPHYDFQCEKCKYIIIDEHYSMSMKPDTIPCNVPKCDGLMRSIIYAPSVNIDDMPAVLPTVGCPHKETHDKTSAKNSTYWRNAELNRQRGVIRKHRAEQEKYRYGDPETVRRVNARKKANKAD